MRAHPKKLKGAVRMEVSRTRASGPQKGCGLRTIQAGEIGEIMCKDLQRYNVTNMRAGVFLSHEPYPRILKKIPRPRPTRLYLRANHRGLTR